MNYTLYKIISGGQTGADMGGLLAARDCGFVTGGYTAKGFLNENGHVDKRLQMSLGLQDLNLTYPQRTLKNVQMAQKTLIVFRDPDTAGTKLTQQYVENENKSYYPFLMTYDQMLYNIQKYNLLVFLQDVTILNVAGNRESMANGIQKYTYKMLCAVLTKIQKRKEVA